MKRSFNLHRIPSIADHRAVVAAEVVKDDEVAPSAGSFVHA